MEMFKKWIKNFRCRYLCKHEWTEWTQWLFMAAVDMQVRRKYCPKCGGVVRMARVPPRKLGH